MSSVKYFITFVTAIWLILTCLQKIIINGFINLLVSIFINSYLSQ